MGISVSGENAFQEELLINVLKTIVSVLKPLHSTLSLKKLPNIPII